MLPNLLVIGAQKSGTTALYRLLKLHPECSVSTVAKEMQFFVDESPWPIGTWHLGVDWYDSAFPEANVVGDVSPTYSVWPVFPGVAERAARVVPDARIAYLVRDPIDRMVAHWVHFTYREYERRPIDEALLDPDPANLYVATSRYGSQLERWLDCFPASHVAAFHQDDVRRGAPQMFRWLGLDAAPYDPGVTNPTSNLVRPARLARLGRLLPRRFRTARYHAPTLSDDTRARLYDLLADDIARFTSLTGVRIEGWP